MKRYQIKANALSYRAHSRCTDIQQNKTKVIFDHVVKHERGIWDDMTAKYDHAGTWRKKYEEKAKERSIIIPKE